MWKTLQARIAEDIHRNQSKSVFYRTGIGIYYLRSLSNDIILPDDILSEFPVQRRKRPVPARVLCIADKLKTSEPKLIANPLSERARLQNTSYHHIGFEPVDALRVLTFVVVMRSQEVLTHRIGKHSHFIDIAGCQTVGFRRYIDEFDLDFFGSDDFGIGLSATRELARGICTEG